MPLLSRKADYALLILSYLVQRPQGGCAREVAAHFGLSRPFIANILKELCHAGFVASHRGVKGGYALTRSADDISLAELIEALEGPIHLVECSKMDAAAPCCFEPVCPVRGPIQEVHRRVREVFRSVSLADLCGCLTVCGGLELGTERFSSARELARR